MPPKTKKGPNGNGGEPTQGLVKPVSTLAFLADQGFTFEKARIAAQVRLAHLKKRGREDRITEELRLRAADIENFLVNTLVELVKEHPTYPWWSRITGAYPKIVGKIIGLIESFGKFYPVGDPMIPAHLWRDSSYTRKPVQNENGESWIWVEGIERFPTRAKIMTYAGVVPGMKREAGKPMPFCGDLKKMLFRFMYYGCILTGNRYKEFYDRYKARRTTELHAQGVKILPTPRGRFCATCSLERNVPSTTWFCPECGERLTGKQEPDGVIWLGHLDNICKRKIMVLFLHHLWEVWRDGEGLPTQSPYPIEKLGHTTFISPWEMCDLPVADTMKTASN